MTDASDPIPLAGLIRAVKLLERAVGLLKLVSRRGNRKGSCSLCDAHLFHAIEDLDALLVAARDPVTEKEQSPDDVMDVYVPGAWKCLKCGFVLSQATLFVASGEVGCSREQVMRMSGESCPNDGEPMARVTWRDRAIENQQWGESLMNDVIAAAGAEHLPGAMERIKELAARDPVTEKEKTLREFIGWLSADIPELHHVDVPRLAESLERFLAARDPAVRTEKEHQ